MEPCYSLAYYDRIFGGSRGPAFWELVAALADELDDYAREIEAQVQAPSGLDAPGLSALRHAHQPLVQNLGLKALALFEQRLKVAVDRCLPEANDAATTLVALARHTAGSLRSQIPMTT